uniref:Uncharacterized protein n=1 Tax=Glossina austeni TaxID=7395 RepID=A0A1A9V498_GLOAU
MDGHLATLDIQRIQVDQRYHLQRESFPDLISVLESTANKVGWHITNALDYKLQYDACIYSKIQSFAGTFFQAEADRLPSIKSIKMIIACQEIWSSMPFVVMAGSHVDEMALCILHFYTIRKVAANTWGDPGTLTVLDSRSVPL